MESIREVNGMLFESKTCSGGQYAMRKGVVKIKEFLKTGSFYSKGKCNGE
jgi:hypothetical protein